ncbi:MAG TPA: hypothetical protein VFN23_17770 [Ktedonobacteraceae bacterium]|nr:hypothetical protein [Ktedonobacteraceae bacterium]
MTIGPDGGLWFGEMNKIGHITPTGKLTEFPAHLVTSPIVSGSDNNLWFVEMDAQGDSVLVRMSPDGNRDVMKRGLVGPPTPITAGPDGNIWVAGGTGPEGESNPTYYTILKITPAGEMTSYSLPRPSQTLPGTLPGWGVSLISGADGAIWFLENVSLANAPTKQALLLGSITPSGTIKLAPVEVDRGTAPSTSQGDELKGAITAGPDGNLWFMRHDGQIGRITPSGVITWFQVPGQTVQELPIITKGADGNLWFSAQPGKLGRITPTGDVKLLPLPAQTQVGGLAATSDHHLWFLNAAETPTGSVWWVHIGRLTI